MSILPAQVIERVLYIGEVCRLKHVGPKQLLKQLHQGFLRLISPLFKLITGQWNIQ